MKKHNRALKRKDQTRLGYQKGTPRGWDQKKNEPIGQTNTTSNRDINVPRDEGVENRKEDLPGRESNISEEQLSD